MRFLRVFFSLVVVIGQLVFIYPAAHATGTDDIVIAQMYPGASGAATQEFVELYNNSSSPVVISDWCVNYISSTGSTTKQLACLTPSDDMTEFWLGPGGYVVFLSHELSDILLTAMMDGLFSSGISASHGHLQVVDAQGNEVDRLGWGDAINPETAAVTDPENGKSLQRKIIDFHLQDTDNNKEDFISSDPFIHSSGVYEQEVIVDACVNIDDIQPIVPSGYLLDENGECQPDSCHNIEGLQVSVPDGYDADENGICLLHDECDNLPDAQIVMPDGLVRGDNNDCVIAYSPLELTEIMPNAIGSDSGNEFVEIYNPGDTTIDLTFYYLNIGSSSEVYSFPAGTKIAPGEYKTFSDNDMKFTLVNSSSRVVLSAIGGGIFGDSGTYENPKEGESWALIGTVWQYSNRPTPGEANLPSIIQEASTNGGGFAPCPAGKYRNPLTNRCRNIVSDAVVFADCGDGKYRNPETNRCKKIESSSSSLTPCKPGQARNPETNRCRSVVSTASAQLKPCKEGQYRSTETNRCRNLPNDIAAAAGFAVQPIKDTGTVFAGWWALAGVGLFAASYGVWEWRHEIAALFRRFRKQ